jgi:hypothetical protein
MVKASTEGRQQHRFATGSTIRVPVLRLISRASFLAATASFLIALLLVYRLWALSTSRVVDGFPEGWLFDLGKLAVAPFRGYDHTQAATEATGYIDFAALIGVEVCLVAILVFSVFGYLFYLLQPHAEKPAPASRETRPSRAQAWSGRAIAGVSAVASRPEWRTSMATGRVWLATLYLWIVEAALSFAETARRAWAAYRAGVGRDAASLRRQWQLLSEAIAPVVASSDRRLQGGMRHARRSLRRARVQSVRLSRASSASLSRSSTRTMAAISSFGAGAGSAIERGSGWYWNNFDAASNRVAAFVSRRAANGTPELTEGPDSPAAPEDGEPLSRRDFLRRFRPSR